MARFGTTAKGGDLRVIEQFIIDFMEKETKRFGTPTNKIKSVAVNPRSENSKKLRKLLKGMKFCN